MTITYGQTNKLTYTIGMDIYAQKHNNWVMHILLSNAQTYIHSHSKWYWLGWDGSSERRNEIDGMEQWILRNGMDRVNEWVIFKRSDGSSDWRNEIDRLNEEMNYERSDGSSGWRNEVDRVNGRMKWIEWMEEWISRDGMNRLNEGMNFKMEMYGSSKWRRNDYWRMGMEWMMKSEMADDIDHLRMN